MSNFLDDESSAESSRPREGFEISTPAVTYRLTSGARDISIGGQWFTASPIARGAQAVDSPGDSKEFTFTLPVTHALAQRYLANGTPPRQILVRVWRKQRVSGDVECLWSGYVTSMKVDRHVATFLVPSRMQHAMQRRLPVLVMGRTCPHVLYDSNCRVVRDDFAIEAIVTVVNGRTITINALGAKSDQWAQFGELEHPASGERMAIMDQTGLVITMQAGIYELVTGDHVIVSPGCTHEIAYCRDTFGNVVNFGGFPDLQIINPFTPGRTNGSPSGIGGSHPERQEQ